MNTANASLPPRGALRYLSLCVLNHPLFTVGNSE